MEVLKQAILQSLDVITVWNDDKLVGLIRTIGDGLTIVYIQDILVLNAYQNKGIASELLQRILNKYKNVDTPVLIMTAKESLDDKMHGFDIGADDYLTKPFYLDELKARIQALLKRTGKLEDSNGLSYGNIRLNLSNKSTLVDDQPVDLIGKEFDLVVYLMQNQNVILPKEQIFDRIWGYDSDTTVTVVEVYMSKIRKKLKDTEFVNNLSTLRNVGYILR